MTYFGANFGLQVAVFGRYIFDLIIFLGNLDIDIVHPDLNRLRTNDLDSRYHKTLNTLMHMSFIIT